MPTLTLKPTRQAAAPHRARFAGQLKRDLPRILFVGLTPDVSPLKPAPAKIGKQSEPADVGGCANKFFPPAAVETTRRKAEITGVAKQKNYEPTVSHAGHLPD